MSKPLIYDRCDRFPGGAALRRSETMSTAPLPPNASNPAHAGGPTAFGRLVDTAISDRSRLDDPSWALASGELSPQLLCRYAAGNVTADQRRSVQELLVRHPWSVGRVTTLVKCKRDLTQSPLAAALLAAATEEGEIDPYRICALNALRAISADDAADALARSDSAALQALELDSLPQALCSLGSGELAAARAALEAADAAAPAVALAQRVAGHDDAEEALVELLSDL